MDLDDFERCAEATGVRQMPQLETPSGWLTDTTDIIRRYEDEGGGGAPAFRPETPLARFFSILLEDYFDEWLWRPALYYRWAFSQDADLMSGQIANGLLRNVRAPFFARKAFIRSRQRREYLRQDGVTRETAPAIERLFLDTLDALEPIFGARPYLFGERPCEADFGLMGPMFRHFSSDPTPLLIMRGRAPRTLLWTSRMWAARPDDFNGAALIDRVPDELDPILRRAGEAYLPYLAANEAAVASGSPTVSYDADGASWRHPASPYRARCLSDLRAAFAGLDEPDRAEAARRIGRGAAILAEDGPEPPAAPAPGARPLDRAWR